MKKLDSKAVMLFFFDFIIRGIFPVAFLSIWFFALSNKINTGINIDTSLIVAAIFVYISFCYIWAELSYKFYRYELTDSGFKKESGILTKKYVTIPYDRIQNININRNIVAQMLRLSSLQIETAGSSAIVGRVGASGLGAEGILPGLTKEIAEQVRDELLARSKKSNQGL